MTIEITEVGGTVEVTTFDVYTTYSFISQFQACGESEEITNENNA